MRSTAIAVLSTATLLAIAALTLAGCISYSPQPAQPAAVLVTPAPAGSVVVPAR